MVIRNNSASFVMAIAGVAVIEIVTYYLRPRLQAARWAHSGELDYTLYIYLFALLAGVAFIFVTRVRKKFENLNLPLTLIILSLIHSNYVLWTLQCGCGSP